MTDAFGFDFGGAQWRTSPEGALLWVDHSIMLVADLHLEKGSWFAAQGQPLPPYDSRATIERVALVAARWQPAEIWCLGDSFHDDGGQSRLDPAAEAQLVALAARHRWLFIAGNHDGLPDGRWGTHSVEEVVAEELVFRHEHDPTDRRLQVSGHYHPKTSVALRGRGVRRPCFALGDTALILPAFGSYTGGLDIDDPAITALLGQNYAALVPTRRGLARFARNNVTKMSQDAV